MKVTLKLYASLRDFLPADAQRNVATIDIAPGMSPHDVMDRYLVPRQRAHLVLLNGVYLQPAERDTPLFSEGDTLAIWPPVAGG